MDLDPDPSPGPEEGEDVSDSERQMAAMMGFGGFGTTKGKEVEGNQHGAVNINKQRTWRQYMNRRGGFNRFVHWRFLPLCENQTNVTLFAFFPQAA
jgi:hypothetical protein